MNERLPQQRLQRWRQAFDPGSAVRRVFAVYGGDEPLPPVADASPYPENKTGRVESAWQSYQQQMRRIEWLDDDLIPYMDVYTGTDIFAAAFGCDVYRPAGEMPSARPMITDPGQVSALKVPDLSHPSLAVLFEIADELHRRGGPEALLKIPDIQSPIDIAALIWDKSYFYLAFHDAPEAVKELADKCRQLLTAFCDEWFSRYGNEFIAHYPAYYMPAGLTLSEDEIGSVNPAMAEEFFLPHLSALSDRYGGLGVHCCANARHQWGTFLKIRNLRVLNLTQNAETTAEAYRFFNEKVIHVHDGQPSDDPAKWVSENIPKAPVFVRYVANDREEALALTERLRAWASEDATR